MAITVEQARLRRANRLLSLGLGLAALSLVVAAGSPYLAILPLLAGVVLVIVGWQLRSSTGDEQPVQLVPGWYDDPETPDRLRYFDGSSWTERTAAKDRSV